MAVRLIQKIHGHDETVNVYYDTKWCEYRVRVVGASVSSTYHTDDREDAIATARMLAGVCE